MSNEMRLETSLIFADRYMNNINLFDYNLLLNISLKYLLLIFRLHTHFIGPAMI